MTGAPSANRVAGRPSGTLDGLVTFWVVLWLALGAWTGYEIWQLGGLSRATVETGHSLRSAASALSELDDVPFVGDRTGPVADDMAATADEIVASGQRAGRSVRGLAILVGLAVALGPSGSLLLTYVPARLARRGRRPAQRGAPPVQRDERPGAAADDRPHA